MNTNKFLNNIKCQKCKLHKKQCWVFVNGSFYILHSNLKFTTNIKKTVLNQQTEKLQLACPVRIQLAFNYSTCDQRDIYCTHYSKKITILLTNKEIRDKQCPFFFKYCNNAVYCTFSIMFLFSNISVFLYLLFVL